MKACLLVVVLLIIKQTLPECKVKLKYMYLYICTSIQHRINIFILFIMHISHLKTILILFFILFQFSFVLFHKFVKPYFTKSHKIGALSMHYLFKKKMGGGALIKVSQKSEEPIFHLNLQMKY